jgi:hypothetical protein
MNVCYDLVNVVQVSDLSFEAGNFNDSGMIYLALFKCIKNVRNLVSLEIVA